MPHTLPLPPTLSQMARGSPVALFLDFDGTLVEIAPRPDAIVVPEGLASGLATLSETLGGRLALISGRAISDIEGHTGPLGIACAGSHGADMRDGEGRVLGNPPAPFAPDLLAEIEAFANANGLLIERKPHGAALHYRHDPSLDDVALTFARDMADAEGLDIKRGKSVIELVGKGANKGVAVAAFMGQAPFSGALPVFVGDDVTDEDGFRIASEMGGFGVLVGDRAPTLARYRLAHPAAVHHWLHL
tara:strand:+ start:144 stop:881 length:738 start_codon:yes stop_codon:yes gene_type:complete